MIYFETNYADSMWNIFVFTGKMGELFHCGICDRDDTEEQILVEIYDATRQPQRILCELVLNQDHTGKGKLFNIDKSIVEGLYDNYNITWTNANYVYDRNRWLISVTKESDSFTMRINDEHDTYDGQFLYHDRIFKQGKLVEMKQYTS
jgi:hypothetical protein